MKRRYGIALLAAGAILLPIGAIALAQGPAKITPGLWETTTEIVDMQMEGMPGLSPEVMQRMKPPPATVRSCVTPQQAANPEASILAVREGDRCDVTKASMTGGTISVAMACTTPDQGGHADIVMTGTYSATSYSMDGAMKMQGQGGMKMNMKSRTTGKRVGDCTG